ncbi:MAG TPA: twin-arginine translocase TatA/TatE family subunit [Thermoanaerobaculia bacterium]|nr:twin-arginine translocase TatA/TatE family subunit [Thermoanaerobaculia bacterium]
MYSSLLILFPSLGVPELLIIFLILLVIFGAAKLPQLGRGLGEGISNFKKGLKETEKKERLEGGDEASAAAGEPKV